MLSCLCIPPGNSREALLKLEYATKAFDDIQRAYEINKKIVPGSSFEILLLHPSGRCHLTRKCWNSFYNYVNLHAGWRTFRRPVTQDERILYGETKKCTVYWVYLKYCTPKPHRRMNESHVHKGLNSVITIGTPDSTTKNKIALPKVKARSKKVTPRSVTEVVFNMNTKRKRSILNNVTNILSSESCTQIKK